MLRIFVTYYAKPGKRDAFYSEIKAKEIDRKSRAEDGCLLYEFFFSQDNPDTAFLKEEWRDTAAHGVHKTQPHFQELQDLKALYLDHTDVIRVED